MPYEQASLADTAQPIQNIFSQRTSRVVSVDIFRGLTMMIMIFVNDLASVKGLPWWNYHMPAQANGMTYVDMVFPAFLFIVGMALPLAIRSRLKRNPSVTQLWFHVGQRVVSLLVLGLILANASKGNGALMGIAPHWWAFAAVMAAVLFWNTSSPRAIKAIGLAALITLLALFRRTAHDGHTAWLDTSYWEILGIIGWAYLSACILYVPTRRWHLAPAAWCAFLLTINIAATMHALPNWTESFDAASCLIVMTGVVTSQIFLTGDEETTFRQKASRALLFTVALALLGYVLSPLGISKIRGTPTWCLYSSAASVLIFTALYWLCDIKKQTAWAKPLKPAGSNTLTTYLLPDLFYFAIAGSAMERLFPYAWPGVFRAVVFTALMLALANLLTRWRVRMQL